MLNLMYSEPEKESQPPAGTSETEQKLSPRNADILENKSDTF